MTMVLMHPANQEQLLSFDVVFLLSTGRFAYKGPADRMQSHFAKFNYSSPPYTNPMDFLADLLTPDASGQSAMYESNVRIEQLLTIESKQDTIPRPFHSSDPWPEPIPRRSFLLTCLVLWL